jgi:hypothetical protein
MGKELLVFLTEDVSFQFSSIVKHRWKKSPGQALAESCLHCSYDKINEHVVSFNSDTDYISDLIKNSKADLFFFFDFNLKQIPIDTIRLLNETPPTSNIFFCCHYEAFVVESILYLRELILNNDTKNLWFISTNAKIFKSKVIPKNLNVAYFDFFSGYFIDGMKDFFIDKSNNTLIDQKDFLCLGLKPRPARLYFTNLLKKLNVYDNGYISLGPNNTLDQLDLTTQDLKLIGNSNIFVPVFTDISKWTNKVYFEVVMEHVDFTISSKVEDEDFIMFTEKIYRAIYNKRPFMVYGKYNYLNYFKSLGFKTYDMMFDESYDLLNNWQNRGRYIAKQVAIFCQKTTNEKEKLYKQAMITAEYNYQHLLKDENIARLFLEDPFNED